MSPLVTHVVPGGAAWSLRVRAGRQVRLTALADGANASLLLFPLALPEDRLNVPDTLKAQHSARVRPPMVLMSDAGLGLASVTGSSLDWHDALGGLSSDVHVSPTSYAEHRNARRLSARTLLLSELRKAGRDRADLHAPVNLFSRVDVSPDGGLCFRTGHAAAGDWVVLRAEVDLLVLLSTAPHPLDPAWAPAAVEVQVSPAPPDDGPARWRPESGRALRAAEAVLA